MSDVIGEAPAGPDKGDKAGADYEVGYCKPPPHGKFQDGNKAGKGRPKGAKNIATIVKQSLGMKVSAKIGGKSIKASKIEIAMHQPPTRQVRATSRRSRRPLNSTSVMARRRIRKVRAPKRPNSIWTR